MENREKLLKRLSAAQFAVWEIHLYLDTHPHDKMAFESYKKYKDRYDALLKEYTEKFGGITPDTTADRWTWVDSPWPWEVIKVGEK